MRASGLSGSVAALSGSATVPDPSTACVPFAVTLAILPCSLLLCAVLMRTDLARLTISVTTWLAFVSPSEADIYSAFCSERQCSA